MHIGMRAISRRAVRGSLAHVIDSRHPYYVGIVDNAVILDRVNRIMAYENTLYEVNLGV